MTNLLIILWFRELLVFFNCVCHCFTQSSLNSLSFWEQISMRFLSFLLHLFCSFCLSLTILGLYTRLIVFNLWLLFYQRQCMYLGKNKCWQLPFGKVMHTKFVNPLTLSCIVSHTFQRMLIKGLMRRQISDALNCDKISLISAKISGIICTYSVPLFTNHIIASVA